MTTIASPDILFEEDDNRGLVLTPNLSAFCTNIIRQPDKNRTNKPQNLGQKNAKTTQTINELDELPISEAFSYLVMLYGNDKQQLPVPSNLFPKWKYLNNRTQATYLQRALTQRAIKNGLTPYAISIRLSPTFGKKILNEGGAPFLQSHLRTYLRRKLKHTPDFWVILEATIGDGTASAKDFKQNVKSPVSRHRGLLHFHGVIALSRGERAAFKAVMRQLNSSNNSTFLQSDIDIKPVNKRVGGGDGWANYVTKHPHLNEAFLPGITRLSRTQSLIKVAESLYKADRAAYREYYSQL